MIEENDMISFTAWAISTCEQPDNPWVSKLMIIKTLQDLDLFSIEFINLNIDETIKYMLESEIIVKKGPTYALASKSTIEEAINFQNEPKIQWKKKLDIEKSSYNEKSEKNNTKCLF